MVNFSFKRAFAITWKEFIKIKMDPTALGMVILIPILQIILFGYSIEFFPKHLPAAIVSYDDSPFTRRFIQAIQSTNYFKVIQGNTKEETAKKWMQTGKINYILTIPVKFTHDLVRGNNPHILLEADASAPGIMGTVPQAVDDLQHVLFHRELQGALSYLPTPPPPFIADVHAVYNPNLLTTYSIVPALIGVVILISLSYITSLAIIEEKEAGNIEVLLNSHVQPMEIMIGKYFSYMIIGYLQLFGTLYLAGVLLFHVPIRGSQILFLLVSLPYLTGNVLLGLSVSAIAKTQLQAQELTTFFFLPSILLSGFLFPFYGMPYWAQAIGNLLPLTHYMRIASGIMLKDYSWIDVLPDLWPILAFVLVMTLLFIFSFKRTLD